MSADIPEVDIDDEGSSFGDWERGHWTLVVLGTAIIGFVVYAAATVGLDVFEQRATFLLMLVLYVLFRFPLVDTVDRDVTGRMRSVLYTIDGALAAVALASYGYLILNSVAIQGRAGIVQSPEQVLTFGAILVVLEATRRTTGNVIPVMILVSIAYVFWGNVLPGVFSHPGFSVDSFATQQFLTTRGLFSFPLAVSLDFIYLFVFFGALLEVTGGGEAFLDLAKVLVGKMRGGPAKLAVVASGFMGMLSGSATANTLTTGAFTIPTMKDHGYEGTFAGGVESAASTGGQLTPPVMGVVVFVMMQLTGLSYLFIIVHAALPALLFFFGIMMAVHFQSVKHDMSPIPDDLIPTRMSVVKRLWYFIPVVAIVALLFFGFSVQRTILLSTGLLAVLAYGTDLVGISDQRRLYDPRIHDLGESPIVEAIDMTAKRATPIIVAATSIGIFIGNIGLTGIGIKISGLVARTGEGNLMLAVLLAAVLSIMFGVMMTSINVYILVAVLVVPGLVELGIGEFQAHMFVFYFGMLAMVTPPVCIAAYAAASIAESDPIRTGVYASLLSAPAYLLPFSYVLDPALLLIGPSTTIATATFTAAVGIVVLAGGIIGYVTTDLGYVERAALIVGAILLMHVSLLTDLVGATIAVAGLVRQLDAIVSGLVDWQQGYRRKLVGMFEN